MPGVFISYRRGQTSAYAGRLHDRLVAELGADHVFMDLSAIGPGVDFVERIEQAVGSADVLLVVIGPDWTAAATASGRRRLDDPEDFVRREVLAAMERDALVVPVLVQGAAMPGPEDLPEPLRPLAHRNAFPLTDTGWSRDVEALMATLRQRVTRSRRRRLPALGAGLAVLAAGVAAIVAFGGGGGGGGSGGARADGDRRAPAVRLRVAVQAVVGGYPLFATAVPNRVWVVQEREDRLTSVDTSGAVADTRAVGDDVTGLAASAGRLWVGDWGPDDSDRRGTVVDLDPRTGARLGRPIPTLEPTAVAADDESVWVADVNGRLQRVDIRERRVTRRIRLGGLAAEIALHGGVVWVPVYETGELLRFDALTGRRDGAPIPVGRRPQSVAATDDAVWVANELGELRRVPAGGGRPQELEIGPEGRRVVRASAAGAWVMGVPEGALTLVDPARPRVLARLPLEGGRLEDVAVDEGGAWVLHSSAKGDSRVVRVVLER